jgi:hypothetical protein
MNQQRLLALYHFCNMWHGGQWSREYALGCKVSRLFRPARSEEYLDCLALPDNVEAREIYVRLARGYHVRPQSDSGYVSCVCCGHAVVVDHIGAESGVTMCDDCQDAECDPHAPCSCEDEDEDEGEDEGVES